LEFCRKRERGRSEWRRESEGERKERVEEGVRGRRRGRKERGRKSSQKGGDYTWKIKEFFGILTHIFPHVHGVQNQLQNVLVENKRRNCP
jgi:hypothetical protein